MTDHITHGLNTEQKLAVTAEPGHLLILAGAGSGKTRVLVHRIAWLMEHEGVSPYAILSVTFTNKAAHEMRGRIEQLRGVPMAHMWVGTFHGLAHRFLRAHWQEANLPESFQILDADDQLRLLKRIHRSLGLDDDKFPPKQSQWFINKQKEQAKRSKDVPGDGYHFTDTMIKVYRAYEDICQNSGLVDFSELLLRCLETLENSKELLEHYQNRFQHILVDEFQDTNTIQYKWLRTLAGPHCFVMAVGDDDQSIYSWRGAKIENIQRFTKEYPDVHTIRLEQNYRSTQTILGGANAVIEHNRGRMGKSLWSDGSDGDPITVYAAFNERDEAYYIMSIIKEWVREKGSYADIAILYRSNAQSRILEEHLIDHQIAYRIYGGVKFFDRVEIRDALAYLRLIANRNDDAAFERVVNTPTRGIGNTTLQTLRDAARDSGVPLWQSACHLIDNKLLSSRASSALNNFLHLIDTLDQETNTLGLGEQCDHILHRSGLLAHYKKDSSEKGLSRVENLEELVNAMSQFKQEEDAEVQLAPLAAFLAHVALETSEGQAEANSDSVNLMTLHAAKGLEFPMVVIAGMEENLFPHRMSIEEPRGLEEERRLCYVGMTRAMKKLYMTHAETRRLHGHETFNKASRFLSEVPADFTDHVRPTASVSRPTGYSRNSGYSGSSSFYAKKSVLRKGDSAGGSGLQIGQRVKHKKFGTGTILNYEGAGEHMRVQVKFDNGGAKWLVANFAKLEAV